MSRGERAGWVYAFAALMAGSFGAMLLWHEWRMILPAALAALYLGQTLLDLYPRSKKRPL